MSAQLAFILRLVAELTWCREDARVVLMLQSSVPSGSLVMVHAEFFPMCPRPDTLFRGLHQVGHWPLRVVVGSFNERQATMWLAYNHHQLRPCAAYFMLGRAAWARQNIRSYPAVKDEWNSSALFLAVVLAGISEPSLHDLLWTWWVEQSVADLTAVVPKVRDGHITFEMHSAFPFADTAAQCGRSRDHPDSFRSWTVVFNNQTIPKELVFPSKYPVKLGGCLMPVNLQYDANIFSPGLFIPDGYAPAMLGALATFLDVKPQRIPAPPDQYDPTPGAPDWSWYDGLAALDSNVADVLVGQYMYMQHRYDRYASLGPHGVSYYRWYLPRPAPTFLPILPHLVLPYKVVGSLVVALFGLILVVALAATLLDASAWSGFLHVWTLFVEQPLTITAVGGLSLSARIATMIALLGFLNVNVLIKSVIVSSIMHPKIHKSFASPTDLVATDNVTVGTESPIVLTLMESSDDAAVRHLISSTVECYLNFTECAEYMQKSSGVDGLFCMISSEEMISFATAGRFRETMYSFDTPLQRNMYGWYARRTFPLKDRANLLFLLLQQSGLHDNWANSLSVNMSAMARWLSTPRPCRDGNSCAINFRRARNLFVLHGIGLLVALSAFVLEHVTRWLTNKHSSGRSPKRHRRRKATRTRKHNMRDD